MRPPLRPLPRLLLHPCLLSCLCGLAFYGVLLSHVTAQQATRPAIAREAVSPEVSPESAAPEATAPKAATPEVRLAPYAGILHRTNEATPGYTLVNLIYKADTYLIDLNGQPVHSWTSDYAASSIAYLLEDGSLLRSTMLASAEKRIRGRGAAGRLERLDWDGNVLWEYVLSNDRYQTHHDIEPLPNGNVLLSVWDKRTREEAIAAGRDPETIGDDGVWSDSVIEIQPTGESGGKIVWQWDLWDHLVQNFSASRANYGDPAEHPELVDLNVTDYKGGPGGDWAHINSLDYNVELDQILLSSPAFHEVWIIDHKTTTEEAAGHRGGPRKRGGDLLYRWGNNAAWMGPSARRQRLFFQHDAQWIDPGLPGAGNILVFNNGSVKKSRNYSTVDEFTPPLNADGTYQRDPDAPFPPYSLAWQYGRGGPNGRFFANRTSGAQRLANGHTLICNGPYARIMEITPRGKGVWLFFNGPNAGLPMSEKAPFLSEVPAEEDGPLGGGGTLFRAYRYPPDYPAFADRAWNRDQQESLLRDR